MLSQFVCFVVIYLAFGVLIATTLERLDRIEKKLGSPIDWAEEFTPERFR